MDNEGAWILGKNGMYPIGSMPGNSYEYLFRNVCKSLKGLCEKLKDRTKKRRKAFT